MRWFKSDFARYTLRGFKSAHPRFIQMCLDRLWFTSGRLFVIGTLDHLGLSCLQTFYWTSIYWTNRTQILLDRHVILVAWYRASSLIVLSLNSASVAYSDNVSWSQILGDRCLLDNENSVWYINNMYLHLCSFLVHNNVCCFNTKKGILFKWTTILGYC